MPQFKKPPLAAFLFAVAGGVPEFRIFNAAFSFYFRDFAETQPRKYSIFNKKSRNLSGKYKIPLSNREKYVIILM